MKLQSPELLPAAEIWHLGQNLALRKFVMKWPSFPRLVTLLVWSLMTLAIVSQLPADEPSETIQHTASVVTIRSTLDEQPQQVRVILPDGVLPKDRSATEKPRPLLVMLHSWSAGMEQRFKDFEHEALARGWIYIFPEFRGPNVRPEACGSELAQQDILDAIDWAIKTYAIDQSRIYLTGVSGGGHMTMLMAGRHPQRFTAASAWVGISDIATWHDLHAKAKYGQMCRDCCGGAPGASAQVDAEYKNRSPITWMAAAAKAKLPVDIAAGIHDGHSGSVPVRQSLDAFNEIAKHTAGAAPISEEEIKQLSVKNGRLQQPTTSDEAEDTSYGRAIYCRRYAGESRVTIFEGGHEGIATAAFAFLEQHAKSP